MSSSAHPALPDFEKVSFGVDIKCECFVKMLEVEHLERAVPIGLIAFYGSYRDGSRGRADALFIDQQLKMFTYLTMTRGLIIDFRELEYSWGNNLQIDLPAMRRRGDPVRIVIPSEEQDPVRHKAFRWLDQSYRQLGVMRETHELRTNLRTAYQEVVDAILRQ